MQLASFYGIVAAKKTDEYVRKIFADHAALEFCRSNPVSLDVDDIIHPPCDLIVSILVSHGPVSTEVESRVGTIVGVKELLMVSVDGSGHSWPRPSHTQVATNVGTSHFLTLKFKMAGD